MSDELEQNNRHRENILAAHFLDQSIIRKLGPSTTTVIRQETRKANATAAQL